VIEVTCGQCGKANEYPDGLAGREWRCQECGASVVIPGAAAGQTLPPAPPPPPATYPPPSPYAPVAAWPMRAPPQAGKALAVCALVFGCLGFIPLLALVGIVLGAIVLIAKKPGKGMAVTGLILGVVLGSASVTAGVLLARRAWRLGDRARCTSNLRQIAFATAAYSSDNDTYFPPDRKRLEPYLGDSELWKCPSAKSGRDCDYVYLFRPDTRYTQIWDPSEAILACDRKGNHREGRNVVFHDMHAEYLTEEHFQARLSRRDNAEFAKHLRKLEGQ